MASHSNVTCWGKDSNSELPLVETVIILNRILNRNRQFPSVCNEQLSEKYRAGHRGGTWGWSREHPIPLSLTSWLTNSWSQGNQSEKGTRTKSPRGLWDRPVISCGPVLLQAGGTAAPACGRLISNGRVSRPAGSVTFGLQDYVEGPLIWANQEEAEHSVNKGRDAQDFKKKTI